MKRLITLLLIACSSLMQAQENPFEEFGYTPTIATLSGGKYVEYFDRDTIVQIGHYVYNTQSQKVIGFIEEDTVYSESTLQPDIVSRWLSPDPLKHKFSSWSPYNFAMDNPVLYIDPDGREVIPVNLRTARTFSDALTNQFSGKVGEALSSSFIKITRTRDVTEAVSRKSFEKLLRKSDLDQAGKAQARGIYNALISDKENYLDIRTFDDRGAMTQEAKVEEGYYNVDGKSATIRGMNARTPEKLKSHKIGEESIETLNKEGTVTMHSTAKDEGSGETERVSLTISLPANSSTVTSEEEQSIFKGVIDGNESTGE